MTNSTNTQKIRRHFEKEDYLITIAQGNSMKPMLDGGQDMVVLKPYKLGQDLQIGDLVLYDNPQGLLTLHRIHQIKGEHLIINGDNNTSFETVDRSAILAVLVDYYHKGKHRQLTDWSYKLYLLFWCRPWPLRFLILNIKRRFKTLLEKLAGKV